MRNVLKLGVALVALCAGLASAAHSEDAWKVLLEQQLVKEEKCQLNYLTDVSIIEKTAGTEIKARAHCEDTRSFDAHLQPGKTKFELSASKPTYC